jgi:carboxyl-terminal processing protease
MKIPSLIRNWGKIGLFAGALLVIAWPQPLRADFSDEERKKHLQSFDKVWETIHEHHWDPKLGGLDWNAVRAELRPKMDTARSVADVRKILNAMIGKLGQSHFTVIPAEVYAEMQVNKEGKVTGGHGVPGFAVRVLDGEPLVTEIEVDCPAWKAGVRPGWTVVQIGKEEVAPLLKAVKKTYKTSTMLDRKLSDVVTKRLRGKQGETVTVEFLNAQKDKVIRDIKLIAPTGLPTKFGEMPMIYVHYKAKKMPGDIAYFSLNAFADPTRVMEAFKQTVKDNLKAKGFILDIRGNPGGIGLMAVGIGNYFITQPDQKLGTMFLRQGKLHFAFNPQPFTFEGPVVILVDGLSASTSEVLAGGLKDLKRAKIIGTRTMGAALPSVFIRLPNGDGFQYAIANYVSVGGVELEGNGVLPDEVVRPTRADLLADRDPALEAALNWLRSPAADGKDSSPK